MSKINESLKKARKIVIKIGSNTLAKADGTQNTEFMAGFAAQCAELIKQGKQIILVSSGAQVAGVSTTKEWARKKRRTLPSGPLCNRTSRAYAPVA